MRRLLNTVTPVMHAAQGSHDRRWTTAGSGFAGLSRFTQAPGRLSGEDA